MCSLKSKLWKTATVSHCFHVLAARGVKSLIDCPGVFHGHRYCSLTEAQEKKLNREKYTRRELELIKLEREKKELEAAEKIRNFTVAQQEKLKMVKQEYAGLPQQNVPKQMTSSNWLNVMKRGDLSHRVRYFDRLARRERLNERNKNNLQIDDEKNTSLVSPESETQDTQTNPGEPKVEKTYNRYHYLYSHLYVKRLRKERGCRALMFGSPLVFDFASRDLKWIEERYLSSVITKCTEANLAHQEPFHFHLTGCRQRENISEAIGSASGTSVHKEDLYEIFPPERLVYVTPYTDTVLQYDTDDIFVLGAWKHDFSSGTDKDRCIRRIRQLGVRYGCLPVDDLIRYKMRKNGIRLETMVKILLDFNFTKDWEIALKHLKID